MQQNNSPRMSLTNIRSPISSPTNLFNGRGSTTQLNNSDKFFKTLTKTRTQKSLLETNISRNSSNKILPISSDLLSPKTIQHKKVSFRQMENQVLKGQVKELSGELHNFKMKTFTPSEFKNQFSSEMIKNLNLKVATKQTLLNKLEKNIVDFKQTIENDKLPISFECKNKMNEILNMINSHQRNFLVKQSVFIPPQANGPSVVIYRQQNHTSQKVDWKNLQFKCEKAQRQNVVLKKQIRDLHQNIKLTNSQMNKIKVQKDIIEIDTKNIILQCKNWKEYALSSDKRCKQFQQKLKIKSDEKIASNEIQLQYLQKTIKQFEIERKQLLQRLQKQTNGNQYYKQLEKQIINLKEQIILLNQQKLQEQNKHMKQSNTLEETITMYRQGQRMQNNETQRGMISSNHIQFQQQISLLRSRVDILLQEKQTAVKQKQEFMLKEKYFLEEQNLRLVTQIESKNTQIVTLTQQKSKIQQDYSKTHQFITILEAQRNRLLKLLQLYGFSIEYNPQNNKDLKIVKQDQYFRYKVDSRYVNLKQKLYSLQKNYYNQYKYTLLYIPSENVETKKSSQGILQLIREMFELMNTFQQTIIIQKSSLKRFNIGRIENLSMSLQKALTNNENPEELKDQVQIISSEFKKVKNELLSQVSQF